MSDDSLDWRLPEMPYGRLAWASGERQLRSDLVPTRPAGLKALLATIPDDKLPSLGVVRVEDAKQELRWALNNGDEAQAENKQLREKLEAVERELSRWRKGEQIEGDYVGPEDDTDKPPWDKVSKLTGKAIGTAADLPEQTTGKGSGDAAHRETAGRAPISPARVGAEREESPEPEPTPLGGVAKAAHEATLLAVAQACEEACFQAHAENMLPGTAMAALADELRGMVGR